MVNRFLIVALLAAALPVSALARGTPIPSRNAARGPRINPTPLMLGTGKQEPLTAEFSVLEKYSIFAVNRDTAPSGGDVNPPPTPPSRPAAAPSPVFRAALRDDRGPLAVIEMPGRQVSGELYLREGQTIPGTTMKVERITFDDMQLVSLRPGAGLSSTLDVPVGHNLEDILANPLPTTPSYVSADAAGMTPAAAQPAAPAIGNRTFGAFRNRFTNANFGAPYNNGFGAPYNGGFAGRAGPLTTNLAPASTGATASAALDPPLPPGSADDIAARMATRRLNQLNAIGSAQ